MIALTRMNGTKIYVSPSSVQYVEAAARTTLQLACGEKVCVRESVADVIAELRGLRSGALSASSETVRPPAGTTIWPRASGM